MINKRYLSEAQRIRTSYLKTMENINMKNDFIQEHKNSIQEIVDKNDEYIKKNKNKSAEEIKESFKDDLLTIDEKINKIVSELQPLLTKIDSLKEDSSNLFQLIKKTYPDLSDEEIQKQVFLFIEK